MSIVQVYGNCPAGEFPSVFTGAFEAWFKRSPRLLFGFLILNPDCSAPAQNDASENLYAVAVCNKSNGTNPKSKPYKICKAMLQPEEYDPIGAAMGVPSWEHFTQPRADGSYRVLEIRVERK